MKRALVVALACTAGALTSACQTADTSAAFEAISTDALHAHIRFLSSDLLEGRAPGTRGSRLAAHYIATQFALAGLAPAVGGTSFLQPVSLVSMLPEPELSFRARGGARFEPTYGPDFVAWSSEVADSTEVEGELVFVGYGISAPEREWNDYKDVDVVGKVLLMFVNDPGPGLLDTFQGDTLTYYGRWTYKFEEARRRGAAGAILIHTRESAGYGWNVVQSSWIREHIELEPNPGERMLGLEAWLSRETADQLLSMAGLSFSTLVESARSQQFRPIETGVSVSARIKNRLRRFSDANVAGLLRGSDPRLRDEVVVYTSHYDHLGIGSPVDSDSIYNGAYDNASGTALLLTLASAFAQLPRPPSRSILFLAVTAEESGLLGSRAYTDSPLIPLERTAANINMDGANIWGRTRDVVALGHDESTITAFAAAAARAEGLKLLGDQAPEQGYMFRSDQFSFMKVGVPVIYIEHGLDYVDRPPGWGERVREEYNEQNYHQPSDEYRPDFDLSGAVQQGRVAFRVGLGIANAPSMPTWSPGSRFRAIRDSILSAGE